MAVFTALTRAEAASFLTQFSIGELTELQGIASGIENTNFFLTTTQARYVRVEDGELFPCPGGTTSEGADLDAVQALGVATASGADPAR